MQLLVHCAFAALVLATGVAWAGPADDYPNRPVRLIVPFPPGGSTDNVGRVLSPKLQIALGQPFLVDNRPGAGAAIGTDMGAKATPDGYTILCTTVASLAINPHLTKVPYDPLRDFAPIAMASFGWMALAVPNTLPARNVPEVIALAKASPGKLFFGSPGPARSASFTARCSRSPPTSTSSTCPTRAAGRR